MKLCIALDLASSAQNLRLAESLGEFDDLWMKVGFRTFIRDGRAFLDTLRTINPHFKIFLDLKLYDIPNTMADAAAQIAELGVDMFNVHASAGAKALEAVMKRLEPYKEDRPLVLAVTALTSFDDNQFRSIYGSGIDEKAKEFASISFEAGLDGVVCSAFESRTIKEFTSKEFLTLCPGIRPFGEDAGDQQRVATLEVAAKQWVDFPVIGRPIYQDPNPKAKVLEILRVIKSLS